MDLISDNRLGSRLNDQFSTKFYTFQKLYFGVSRFHIFILNQIEEKSGFLENLGSDDLLFSKLFPSFNDVEWQIISKSAKFSARQYTYHEWYILMKLLKRIWISISNYKNELTFEKLCEKGTLNILKSQKRNYI